MTFKLFDICQYVKGKIDVSLLNTTTYISTENMLSDKGGVTEAANLPTTVQAQIYEQGDVLISNIRPYFKKIWLANRDGGCSNDVLVLRANEGIDPNFLYYVLSDDKFFNYSVATSKGTKMPRGDKIALMEFDVPNFDITMQKKVVSILGNIDRKISLNSEINKNLLQQMESLYKAWFTDFIPFGGSRPSDWRKSDIYSIADIIYGAPFSSKLFNTDGEGIPIIRIRDLRDQAFVTYTTENHPKGHLIQPGDIVVGMDGEFRPYIWGNTEAWLNQRVCIFNNKRPKGKAFVLFTIKPLLYRIEQTQVATTVIHIGKKDYDAFELYLPDSNTLDQFDELTSPMVDQIVVNCLENKSLATLRDSLLPRLMSGELDVSDIDL